MNLAARDLSISAQICLDLPEAMAGSSCSRSLHYTVTPSKKESLEGVIDIGSLVALESISMTISTQTSFLSDPEPFTAAHDINGMGRNDNMAQLLRVHGVIANTTLSLQALIPRYNCNFAVIDSDVQNSFPTSPSKTTLWSVTESTLPSFIRIFENPNTLHCSNISRFIRISFAGLSNKVRVHLNVRARLVGRLFSFGTLCRNFDASEGKSVSEEAKRNRAIAGEKGVLADILAREANFRVPSATALYCDVKDNLQQHSTLSDPTIELSWENDVSIFSLIFSHCEKNNPQLFNDQCAADAHTRGKHNNQQDQVLTVSIEFATMQQEVTTWHDAERQPCLLHRQSCQYHGLKQPATQHAKSGRDLDEESSLQIPLGTISQSSMQSPSFQLASNLFEFDPNPQSTNIFLFLVPVVSKHIRVRLLDWVGDYPPPLNVSVLCLSSTITSCKSCYRNEPTLSFQSIDGTNPWEDSTCKNDDDDDLHNSMGHLSLDILHKKLVSIEEQLRRDCDEAKLLLTELKSACKSAPDMATSIALRPQQDGQNLLAEVEARVIQTRVQLQITSDEER